jgi:hypothetical protein
LWILGLYAVLPIALTMVHFDGTSVLSPTLAISEKMQVGCRGRGRLVGRVFLPLVFELGLHGMLPQLPVGTYFECLLALQLFPGLSHLGP